MSLLPAHRGKNFYGLSGAENIILLHSAFLHKNIFLFYFFTCQCFLCFHFVSILFNLLYEIFFNVSIIFPFRNSFLLKCISFIRMYDVDGNGVIDQDEMSKIIQVIENFSSSGRISKLEWCTQAIYDMLGQGTVKPTDTAEERSKNIFMR